MIMKITLQYNKINYNPQDILEWYELTHFIPSLHSKTYESSGSKNIYFDTYSLYFSQLISAF